VHLRTSVFAPTGSARLVDVDDEAVVIDEATGALFLLNATGALVWRCLDGESSLGEICDDLCDLLELDCAEVEEQAAALTASLLELGLVVDLPARAGASATGDESDECGCGRVHDDPSVELDDRLLVDPPSP
jgi:PqqD family protein of HPr-rel-A system